MRSVDRWSLGISAVLIAFFIWAALSEASLKSPTWLESNAKGRPVKIAYTTSFPPDAYGIQFQRLEVNDLMREPGPGLYAVSAQLVARAPAFSAASDWLRQVQPRAIVGHAIYVYDIPAR